MIAFALQVVAFVAFAVLVAVVPYVRRKRGYWTSRGVPVSGDRRAVACALPGLRLDDRSVAAYWREATDATAAPGLLGLHDAGRPCALACDLRVAAAALGNHGFAEPSACASATLVPATVDADNVAAVLPAMAECVAELITSLEGVANRRLTVTPWTEVRKCATMVVATCVYGQPMVHSRIEAFAEQCERARRNRTAAAACPEYFAAYDVQPSGGGSAPVNFMRLLTAAAEDSDKIRPDVADKQVRSDMFEFVTCAIEPTAALVAAALYELARDQEVQSRLREHLDGQLDRYQTRVTIDQLDRLTYLENVLRETLRKYPLAAVVRRVTTKPYAVPRDDGGRTCTLEPGTLTVLPVHAYHHDERNFVAPETFQPERFPSELSSAYMPFGSGPRSYIGKHFVSLEAKLIVAMLVSRYEVHVDNNDLGKTPDPFDLTSYASIRVKLFNRSDSTMGASLRQLDSGDKKFLFF